MKSTSQDFKQAAARSLKDQRLQSSLKALGTFQEVRQKAKQALPEFQELSNQAR